MRACVFKTCAAQRLSQLSDAAQFFKLYPPVQNLSSQSCNFRVIYETYEPPSMSLLAFILIDRHGASGISFCSTVLIAYLARGTGRGIVVVS